MDENDPFDAAHPRPVPDRLRQGPCEEVAVRGVLARLLFGGRQDLELRLLDRLRRAFRPGALAGLDLLQHLLVTEAFQGGLDRGPLAFVLQVRRGFDDFQILPDLRDRLLQRLAAVG